MHVVFLSTDAHAVALAQVLRIPPLVARGDARAIVDVVGGLMARPEQCGSLELDRVAFERERVLAALRRAPGNHAEVARQLGIPYTTLKYRLTRLGLLPPAPRAEGLMREDPDAD